MKMNLRIALGLLFLIGMSGCHCEHRFQAFKVLLPNDAIWESITGVLTPMCQERGSAVRLDFADAMNEIAKLSGNVEDRFLENIKARISQTHREYPKQRLRPFSEDYLLNTVNPFTACLTLDIPHHFPLGVPVLHQNGKTILSLTKAHAAMLLSGGYWGAILRNGPTKIYHYDTETKEYSVPKDIESYDEETQRMYRMAEAQLEDVNFNEFNFFRSFIDEQHKYAAFMAYLCNMTYMLSPYYPFDIKQLKRVTDPDLLNQGIFGGNQVSAPYERIDFALNAAKKDIDWSVSEKELVPIVLNVRRIEDALDSVHVDFADKYIGGTYFANGNLQEELYFATHPECIVSMLFTPRLADNEALIIAGAELYALHSGYGKTFTFEGCAMDCWFQNNCEAKGNEGKAIEQTTVGNRVPLDKTGRRSIFLSAIDTVEFSYIGRYKQFETKYLHRELMKAHEGFRDLPYAEAKLPISTGNWGCGEFGGNISFKALIQWIVTSHLGRTLLYSPFDEPVVKNIGEISKELAKKYKTVGQLYKHLVETIQDPHPNSLGWNLIEELLNKNIEA